MIIFLTILITAVVLGLLVGGHIADKFVKNLIHLILNNLYF